MTAVSNGTGRRSPLLERGTEHGGGEQRRLEAERANVGKASTRWHELVSELARPALSQPKPQTAPQTLPAEPTVNQNSPPHSAKDSESQAVRSTLEKAVQAAKADAQWSASGLPESLQRTVQLCSSEGPGAAKTAALGLLDFHQIVKNTKLRSPKTPSPPVSPHREDERPSSKEGPGSATANDDSRRNHAAGKDNVRLVTSGLHSQGPANGNVIGHSSSTQTDRPARIIVREAPRETANSRAAAGHDKPQSQLQADAKPEASSQLQEPHRVSHNQAIAERTPAVKPVNGKEMFSPIALQVATLMRDHLKSIQANAVLPPVSLELPAVPQLQLDSLVGPPISSAGLQPAAASQHIAVINSSPLLVIPSSLSLPPEPALYRPVRPNRTISAPTEAGQRPTQPIRCISAPSRLPTDGQTVRPGNVISSGVPQAHPRYREIGRLTPSPITKPNLPAQKAAEVKVRVVHAPARASSDVQPPTASGVKRAASSPAAAALPSEEQPVRSVQESRALSPLQVSNHLSAASDNPRSSTGKAERLLGPSLSSDTSPFAHTNSGKSEDGRNAARSPSPEEDHSPKRRRLNMQKALSLNTVLRCVDAKHDHGNQDEALDAHVGEAPTTVEDMAQVEGGAAAAPQRIAHTQSAPTQTSPTAVTDASARPHRNTPSPTSLHQMVRQVCEAVGETWRNSLQQHIQSSMAALGPGPQPLHAGPRPPQNGRAVGPSGLPAGTLSIYGGSSHSDEGASKSPGPVTDAAMPDAAAAAVGRGFHLGDMPPCDDMDTSSKTALWSGKVKHKHGGSVVELFHMTALIPEQYLERLPPTLFASELANRSNVNLGRHYVMRCKLGFLTDRQLHKLHMLAHLKLVAICHLQHAIITLVPYYNSQNGFKVVGFMLADD
ncbi:hypothetical protein WJX74_005051 [Apatococcus lobatus]|uniref:Uncharacterized protein n=1 Tax=Apatococcus lobatus TaxID=904363 RepID=A0AAW1RPW3_9CHLO